MEQFDKTQPIRLEPQSVRFHGTGAEYFGIWIVNLLLTIVTFGIYSAWAKVRKQQYFYRNTELAGSSFDYHGDPLTIFKGRIIAVVLLLLYKYSFRISPTVGVLTLLLLAAVLPVLLRNSLRFRLYNSSYRGLRFRFDGSVGGAYETFLWGWLGSVLSLGFALPYFHQRLKAYQHGNSRFGQTRFSFAATPGQFYAIYGMLLLMIIGLLVCFGVFAGGALSHFTGPDGKPDPKAAATVGAAFVFAFYLPLLLFAAPYLTARLQNLIWNNTRLGEHRFEYRLSARRLLWLNLTNLLGIVLTLGFFTPWAMVRLARYRAECMTLVPASALDEFVADQAQEIGAAGEEAASVFDIDISF